MFKLLIILLLFSIQFICIQSATVDPDYFPGLRKSRPTQNWQLNDEDKNYLLSQLNAIIEEQARRRYLHQLQQQQLQKQFKDDEIQKDQYQHQQQQQIIHHKHNVGGGVHGGGGPSLQDEIATPGFTYQFKPIEKLSNNNDGMMTDKLPIFGITPSDPNYYAGFIKSKNLNNNNNKHGHHFEEDYQNLINGKDDDQTITDGIASYKLKSPMEINPQLNSNLNANHNNIKDDIGSGVYDNILINTNPSSKSTNVLARNDLKMLLEKLQSNGQENAIINKGSTPSSSTANTNAVGQMISARRNDFVLKKHLEMDATLGMYVVAIIAGVSAAVTVGLISLGIGWYTLHKKAKAAADVEYPAYGITGPNKDQSPNAERRLAQSAHMYHYQHQKQQIIAMENRTNGERNGSLSEVESDDENEEGDYTVYECPGLAPTGEMEVKNPLFLDDPTPASPAINNQQPTNISVTTTSTTPSIIPNNNNNVITLTTTSNTSSSTTTVTNSTRSNNQSVSKK